MNAQQFLSDHGVAYDVIRHQPTYSAQRMAQKIHVPGDEVAKTVLLRADGTYVLAVLPATHRIDLEKARDALGVGAVELATELEFEELFPDCDLGALPPFGSQYGLVTLVDESLADDETIAFEGNTHVESICIEYADFAELEHPKVASFTHHT